MTETKIPRTLKTSNAGHSLWNMKIGTKSIGEVARVQDKKGKPVYEFEGRRPDVPAKIQTRTMKELKEELTRRISRDKYMEILEGKE